MYKKTLPYVDYIRIINASELPENLEEDLPRHYIYSDVFNMLIVKKGLILADRQYSIYVKNSRVCSHSTHFKIIKNLNESEGWEGWEGLNFSEVKK